MTNTRIRSNFAVLSIAILLFFSSPTPAHAQQVTSTLQKVFPFRLAFSLGNLIYNTTVTIQFAFTYDTTPFPPEETVTLTTDKYGHVSTALVKGVYEIRPLPTENQDIFTLSTSTVKYDPSSSNKLPIIHVGIIPGKGRVIQKPTPTYYKLNQKRFFPRLNSPSQAMNLLRNKDSAINELASIPKFSRVMGINTQEVPNTANLGTTIQLFVDSNKNGIRDKGEPDSYTSGVTIQLRKADQNHTYSLLEGWNLVSFPGSPSTFTSAQELTQEIAQEDGYITTIATWNKGKWKEFVARGDNTFSDDFPIEPGTAYFLRSHEVMDWLVTSIPTKQETITVYPGWNSIGFVSPPENLKAEQVLDALNRQNSKQRATEIDWWRSGFWEVFVKRIFDKEDIQTYGTDFKIDPQKGYMVKAYKKAKINLDKLYE